MLTATTWYGTCGGVLAGGSTRGARVELQGTRALVRRGAAGLQEAADGRCTMAVDVELSYGGLCPTSLGQRVQHDPLGVTELTQHVVC